MSWADGAIEELRAGREVTVRPRGHSMEPKVPDGATVLLVPAKPEEIQRGDIVLVRVAGNVYLHLVRAVQGRRFLIGNNKGSTNGWAGPAAVYGLAVKVDGQATGRRR